MNVIPDRSRNANSSDRAFRLKPRCHIYCIAMQVRPVRDCVSNVDPDSVADRSIGGLGTVLDRDLFLNRQSAPHRTVDAVEYDQQRVATGLDEPATMLSNCWVNHISTQNA
jgi:hypothetical protein